MTLWQTGDTITAERLNGMMVEPLITTVSNYGVLDKTWKEIRDAFVAGIPCIYHYYRETPVFGDTYYVILEVSRSSDEYAIFIAGTTRVAKYATNSENGYPQHVSES